MASFYSLLGFLAVDTFEYSPVGSFDMLSALPVEMAITILRLLPSKDILNAVCVNKRWLQICKTDRQLRQKIKRRLIKLRRARLRMLTSSDPVGRNPTTSLRQPAMANSVNTAEEIRLSRRSDSSRPRPSLRYSPYTAVRPKQETRYIKQSRPSVRF